MQKSVCSHQMSEASKMKYVCVQLVSYASFHESVCIAEYRHSPTYTVVTLRKVWRKSNCAQLGFVCMYGQIHRQSG